MGESDKLKDVLEKPVPEENTRRLENVQSAVSDSSVRYDADEDDEVGVHLDFRRRYVYFSWARAEYCEIWYFNPSNPKKCWRCVDERCVSAS